MFISTRGRYALRVMIDLAEQDAGRFVPLGEIAARQEISEKYLESIIVVLSKTGLLIGVRGKGGGYKLSKPPEEYTVKNILELTDGSLSPVACLTASENTCPRQKECKTLPMWEKLYSLIDAFFEGITLKDLVCGNITPDLKLQF